MKNKTIALLLLVMVNTVFNPVKAQVEIDVTPNGKTYSQMFDSLSTDLIPSRIPRLGACLTQQPFHNLFKVII